MTAVTIVGGHGKVALLLAKELTAKGFQVKSLFRNSDHKADVARTGADPQVFDIESANVDDIASQFKGADAIVFSAGAGGGNPSRTYAVDRDAAIRTMKAAEQANVKRYVMVSYLGAGPNHGVPKDNGFYAYAEAKAAADTFLRSTKLDWTILMPGMLSLEEPTGKIEYNPPKDKRTAVSRANVALVAAAVLQAPNTVHKEIPFLDGDEKIADVISRI